ncbi:MAG: acyl-CoA dehydrogenase [Rhodospirillaceae bacterium]|jgi:3-(methylthio)propanoyl-CoA dehydrogenase|nr:acyl-CoA dehydrogenase [Rhodospirillaceae bacterium]MBT7957461.1 acyl-CoA dehydrogenase [Rhodospirillaceae bacterium]
MTDFQAPVRDMRFALSYIADIENIATFPGYEDATPDIIEAIIEESGKFAEQVLAPLNHSGDQQGCRLENGRVHTPDGFKEAFQQMSESGWHGISLPQEFGGQGLPYVLTIAATEMWSSANMAFCLVPQLAQSATELLVEHGSESQKATYLPNIVAGKWVTTMNLTEPQAGTDLSLLRTKADPDGDHYKISGQKIFITGGDNDLAENIIHLVLARTPDSPAGLKGISLFAVPKFLINDDGSLGQRNDLKCVSLEHKMGIHGSPTCVMSYGDNEGAVGYLIGEENQGLTCMFTMMNLTRLLVGIQGPGIGERAYQQAANYARERVQGANSSGETVPIIEHPDVKRMLLDMKAKTEACRSITIYTASCIDRSKRAPADAERAKFLSRLELLTPIAKAWCSNVGIDIASTGIQVHGGTGFIEETGAAQHYRDIRITAIFEGANGIQAKDLVGRKVIRDNGEALKLLSTEISETVTSLLSSDHEDLKVIGQRLSEGLDQLNLATEWILTTSSDDMTAILASATTYLDLLGIVVGGWLLGKSAAKAAKLMTEKDADEIFLQGKILSGRYFAEYQLVSCASLKSSLFDGADTILRFNAEMLN